MLLVDLGGLRDDVPRLSVPLVRDEPTRGLGRDEVKEQEAENRH